MAGGGFLTSLDGFLEIRGCLEIRDFSVMRDERLGVDMLLRRGTVVARSDDGVLIIWSSLFTARTDKQYIVAVRLMNQPPYSINAAAHLIEPNKTRVE